MPRRFITTIAAFACLSLVPIGAAAAVDSPPPSSTVTDGLADQVASRTEGTLRLTVADDFAGKSVTTALVQTPSGTIKVPASLVASLTSGAAVTVARDVAGKVLGVERAAVAAASTDAGLDQTAGISGTGTHNIWTVRVSWPGAAAPALPATLVPALTSYYSTISASPTGARIKVASQGALPDVAIAAPTTSTADCGAAEIYQDAAAKLGAALPAASRFNHVMLILPDLPDTEACWWYGLASIGASTDGRAHIWINGAKALTPRVLDHEFGHNLGLMHSDWRYSDDVCTQTTAKQSMPTYCYNAYADPWDVMGGGHDENVVGFMSAPNLDRIGLLSGAEKYTLASTASPTLRIAPVSLRSGRRLVTIPYGSRTFTVEYRYGAPGTLDSWLPTGGNGAVVRLRDTSVNEDLVLTQLTTNGSAFAVSGLKIAVNNFNAQGVDVTVTRSRDTVAPAIGQYGYWNSEKQIPHVGVVLTQTTLAVGYAAVGDSDSGISSVTLDVDGKARAATTSVGLTKLAAGKLSQGTHKWRFVIKDLFGNKRATSYETIRVDTGGKPAVTRSPRASLAKGTVSTKLIPATVSWSATDGCGIVWNSVAGSNGLKKSYYGKPKAISTRLKTGSNQFAVRAADCLLHATKVSTGPKTSASLDKQSKRKGYHGSWKASKATKALGGTEQQTTKKGAYVSYKVKARSIGWVATTGSTRGKAAVYVDGKKVAVVNLHASKTHYAQQVFTKTFSKAGTHTIKIVNLSSKKIGIDGFTRLS